MYNSCRYSLKLLKVASMKFQMLNGPKVISDYGNDHNSISSRFKHLCKAASSAANVRLVVLLFVRHGSKYSNAELYSEVKFCFLPY